jgi:hypothetical protein
VSAPDEPRKRPSPTSRARRIGGAAPRSDRPAPAPAPDTEPAGGSADASQLDTPAAPAPARTPEPPVEVEDDRADRADRSGRSVPARWLPAGVLGLAALVLLVLVAVFSHGVYWAKPDNSAGNRAVAQEQVLAAAKKCFVQINSYDYRDLGGLVAKDTACTTGAFTADLRKALQTQILKLAPKLHARQSAQVNKAGIASVSPDGKEVVTLIYGQFSVTNDKTAKKQPRVDVVGAVVTVSDVNGTWRISRVDADVPSG